MVPTIQVWLLGGLFTLLVIPLPLSAAPCNLSLYHQMLAALSPPQNTKYCLHRSNTSQICFTSPDFSWHWAPKCQWCQLSSAQLFLKTHLCTFPMLSLPRRSIAWKRHKTVTVLKLSLYYASYKTIQSVTGPRVCRTCWLLCGSQFFTIPVVSPTSKLFIALFSYQCKLFGAGISFSLCVHSAWYKGVLILIGAFWCYDIN